MKSYNEIPDWPLILNQLSESNLDFLVVGGGALVLHGIPRTTLDLDIYVPSDEIVVSELVDILKNNLKLEANDEAFLSLIGQIKLLEGQWFSFSIPNGPDIIDIYICRKGEFNELSDSADIIEVSGSPIHVASLDTLKNMKKKSGRPIDLADIALIDEYNALFDND